MARLKDIPQKWGYAYLDWTKEHRSWQEYEFCVDGETRTHWFSADWQLIDDLIVEYLKEKQGVSEDEAADIYEKLTETEIEQQFGAALHDYFYKQAMKEIENY